MQRRAARFARAFHSKSHFAFDGRGEPVSLSRNGKDERAIASVFAEHLAQQKNVLSQIRFIGHVTGPNVREEPLFVYNVAIGFQQ